MSENFLHAGNFAITYLVLFLSAEFLYHKRHWKVEVTRKIVHAFTGLIALLFPLFIDNHWYIFALCASFLVILYFSLRFAFLPSINNVERKTTGSILFPIIVYLCYLISSTYSDFLFYYTPILILAISDPAAAFFGKRWPIGKFTIFGQSKTLSGSLGFFLTAFISTSSLAFVFRASMDDNVFSSSIYIAIVSTVAEAITHNGYDNLTIPVSILLVLVLI